MKKFICSLLLLSTLTLLVLALPSRAATSAPIYDDELAEGWQNWSWETTLDFAATAPVKVGARAVAVTYTQGWSGMYLHHDGLPIGDKKGLEFWIFGAAQGGQNITIYAEDDPNRPKVHKPLNAYVEGGAIAASEWRKVRVPLADLSLSGAPLTSLVIFNNTETAQGQFFVDDIRLISDGPPAPYMMPPFGPPAPTYPQSAPVGDIPAALPAEFMIGLKNSDAKWIVNSGSKWQARYQYLTEGVNTTGGWASWGTPRGQFATDYLNNSSHAGVLPVFTYYQILQSEPRGADEHNDAYIEKFANAATMRAYYDDFQLLMEKCGAFDKPVIVHVEPDVWGYLWQTRPDPNDYVVQVAASGHADATGLPDSAVGFAAMLARLRDKYAPKVLLAIHASSWSGGHDVTLNREPALNIAQQAETTANFLNQLNAGWDLIFTDFADRDAAYRQLTTNENERKFTWWDESNVRLPSFHQAHYWLSQLNQKTGKRIMVWQVPVGNTKMLSSDNTKFHYQDNRVQYYLGADYGKTHIEELKNCGVIGLFFGAGDETNTTTPYDWVGDGITEPAPISGNVGVAAVADDDGGYLRERNKAYQADPVSVK